MKLNVGILSAFLVMISRMVGLHTTTELKVRNRAPSQNYYRYYSAVHLRILLANAHVSKKKQHNNRSLTGANVIPGTLHVYLVVTYNIGYVHADRGQISGACRPFAIILENFHVNFFSIYFIFNKFQISRKYRKVS